MKKEGHTSKRRRHPRRGGYRRGDEARARILRVAIEAFGLHGYEGTSTRSIADLASVAAPVLQYYFDGKPGLYAACGDHIAEVIGTRLASALDQARRSLADDNSTNENILLRLHALLSDILDMLLDSKVETWALFILHEQAHPTSAFDGIFDRIMGPTIATCTALIAKLGDMSPNDPQAALAALCLYGQITSFRVGQEAVLRVLGTRKLTDAHRLQIKAGLLRQIRAFVC